MNTVIKHEGSFIVHLDPDLKYIIPVYLQNRGRDIDTITKSLESNDFEKIKFLGHDMKGTGGGYGFDMITDIGRALEAAAKDKNCDEIRQGLKDLSGYLLKVEVVYDAK